jgi:CDP-diacylglycerol--serine O-phosphatidyltransferase
MVKKHIPNFITCLNICAGSIAVILAVKGDLPHAVLFIFLAAIFDFLDGMAARLLHAYSPIGKELDSLADMISFGLAPGVIMMTLLEYSIFGLHVKVENLATLSLAELLTLSVALLIPVASGLRLAKFNIDTRQTDSFIGLPTPANALFISALALIIENGRYQMIDTLLSQPITLIILTVAMSYLLVSEVHLFSLKLKTLNWKENQIQYIFLILSAGFILFFCQYGIAASIILYLLISIFFQPKK